MKHKVLVYILRPTAASPELLVFEHRDFPAAGVQVPAGTVEPGESLEAAACREVLEEAGLGTGQVRLVQKLTDFPEPQWHQHRHVFLFEPVADLPDRWAHTVRGQGGDQGMVFNFYWRPAVPAPELSGRQHRSLRLALDAFEALLKR